MQDIRKNLQDIIYHGDDLYGSYQISTNQISPTQYYNRGYSQDIQLAKDVNGQTHICFSTFVVPVVFAGEAQIIR